MNEAKCGTRGAPQAWINEVERVLIGVGFQMGEANPCGFVHPLRGISVTVRVNALALAKTKRWRDRQSSIVTLVTREQIHGGVGLPKINSELLNRVARHASIQVSVTRKPTAAHPEGRSINMIRDAVVRAWPAGVVSLTLEN